MASAASRASHVVSALTASPGQILATIVDPSWPERYPTFVAIVIDGHRAVVLASTDHYYYKVGATYTLLVLPTIDPHEAKPGLLRTIPPTPCPICL